MIDQETRELALDTFRKVLQDVNAKPADKLRAAEGVMRLEAEQRDAGIGDILDASDDQLLKWARGEEPTPGKDDLERFASGE